MPRLVEILEKYNKRGVFSKKPLGPIGQYVDVPNSKWRPLIEHFTKSHLTAFCFNTVKDRQEFDKMVQREFGEIPKFMKIVTQFQTKDYDVRNKMVNPPPRTTSVLNEIKVANSIIRNILIDQLKLETILMCEGSQDAVYYASDQSRIPQNLSKIYSHEPFAEYLPAPNFRSYGMVLKPCRYLQRDLAEYKKQLDTELVEIKMLLQSKDAEWKTKQDEVKNIQSTMKGKNNQISAAENALQILNRQILEIKSVEYPSENEVEMLEREKIEMEQVYAQTLSKMEDEREKTRNMEKDVEESEREMCTLKKDIQEIEMTLQRKTVRYLLIKHWHVCTMCTLFDNFHFFLKNLGHFSNRKKISFQRFKNPCSLFAL